MRKDVMYRLYAPPGEYRSKEKIARQSKVFFASGKGVEINTDPHQAAIERARNSTTDLKRAATAPVVAGQAVVVHSLNPSWRKGEAQVIGKK